MLYARRKLTHDHSLAAEAKFKDALQRVNEQMEALKADYMIEQSRLQGDNIRLRDFVAEVRAKSDSKFEDLLVQVEITRSEAVATQQKLREDKLQAEKELESAQRVRC